MAKTNRRTGKQAKLSAKFLIFYRSSLDKTEACNIKVKGTMDSQIRRRQHTLSAQ
jgi:hypothetical protein